VEVNPLVGVEAGVPVPWELVDEGSLQSPYVTSNFPAVAVWEREAEAPGGWRLAGLFNEDGTDGRLTDVHPDGSELWAAVYAAHVMELRS
jgi:hypothetical protein